VEGNYDELEASGRGVLQMEWSVINHKLNKILCEASSSSEHGFMILSLAEQRGELWQFFPWREGGESKWREDIAYLGADDASLEVRPSQRLLLTRQGDDNVVRQASRALADED
jgi:hypothetical protein